MSVFDTGDPERYVNVDGMRVERDALAVAERLKEIDPDLEIFCVDPTVADFAEAPFIVAELCADGKYRRIFECWTLDRTVVERAQAARIYGDNILNQIDAVNKAVKAEEKRQQRQREEARFEIVGGILRSPKSSYTYTDPDNGDKVTIHESKPAERVSAE